MRYLIAQGPGRPPIRIDLDPPPPCLYCGAPVASPSTDGPLVCGACDCGCNADGSRWTPDEARRRHDHHRAQVAKYRDLADARDGVDPTSVVCPTCHAWKGWACEGRDYGYHAAGYHPSRHHEARRSKERQMAQDSTTKTDDGPGTLFQRKILPEGAGMDALEARVVLVQEVPPKIEIQFYAVRGQARDRLTSQAALAILRDHVPQRPVGELNEVELQVEVTVLRSECDRVRPVYEAARAWRSDSTNPTRSAALAEAVDAAVVMEQDR